jgi:ornithine carbamoyltransferase
MKKKDLLTLQDFQDQDIWNLLKTTRRLKNNSKKKKKMLKGRSVVLLFQKASTRTRISFEVAINQLGGHSIYLGWSESQLSRGETIVDTARVLERYVDCVIARVYKQSDLKEIARSSSMPIVNALSNIYHPCQIVADLYTIWEHRGYLNGLKLAYIGDGNNVCNSLLIGCTKTGINISVACPPAYKPRLDVIKSARKNAKGNRSKVEIIQEPTKAVKNADFIYTDTFVSMGNEDERKARLDVFLPKYQVTADLFKYASEDALFMHCLPAHRNEEVTDEIMDSSRSIIWDQAENRMHTAKAILTNLILK